MSLARPEPLVRACVAAVVAGAGSLGLVLAAAGPAAACSCVGLTAAEQVEMADTVFTGVLEEREVGRQVAQYTFAVEEVLEGDPGPRAVVTSAASGASCGLERMDEGTRYVVLATAEAGGLDANLCGGTAPAAAYAAEVAAVTGPGRPPAGAGSSTGTETGPPSDEAGEARADGEANGLGAGTRALAVGGAAVAVVVGAALVVTRRQRR